ncbi:MAG: MarR family transcriptional regulator [Firmicutes bacterium HGW-Firmicutes-16]|nr:MAG: MarR family transcriptional regulator [Firmicutes bacterium HGW-Firmicutes-16]
MSTNETNLLEEFNGVSKLLSKYQLWHYRKFGPSGDPHRGQGRVLAILKLQPEISQKDLGYLLDMRNQSLGELLGKLEKSGAIIREPSQEDRRSMNIRLTEYGAKLIGQSGRKPDDIGRVFDCLSEDERDKLHEILGRLSGELEMLLGSDVEAANEKTSHRSEGHHHKNEAEKSSRRKTSNEYSRESDRPRSGEQKGGA